MNHYTKDSIYEIVKLFRENFTSKESATYTYETRPLFVKISTAGVQKTVTVGISKYGENIPRGLDSQKNPSEDTWKKIEELVNQLNDVEEIREVKTRDFSLEEVHDRFDGPRRAYYRTQLGELR